MMTELNFEMIEIDGNKIADVNSESVQIKTVQEATIEMMQA